MTMNSKEEINIDRDTDQKINSMRLEMVKGDNDIRKEIDDRVNERIDKVDERIRTVEQGIRRIDEKHDEKHRKVTNDIGSIKTDTEHISRQNDEMRKDFKEGISRMEEIVNRSYSEHLENYTKTKERINDMDKILVSVKDRKSSANKLAMAVIPAVFAFLAVIFQVLIPMITGQ